MQCFYGKVHQIVPETSFQNAAGNFDRVCAKNIAVVALINFQVSISSIVSNFHLKKIICFIT